MADPTWQAEVVAALGEWVPAECWAVTEDGDMHAETWLWNECPQEWTVEYSLGRLTLVTGCLEVRCDHDEQYAQAARRCIAATRGWSSVD